MENSFKLFIKKYVFNFGVVMTVLIDIDDSFLDFDPSLSNLISLNLPLEPQVSQTMVWFLTTTHMITWKSRQTVRMSTIQQTWYLIQAELRILSETKHNKIAKSIEMP